MKVSNNSAELISDVTVTLASGDMALTFGPGHFGVIAPTTVLSRIVITDADTKVGKPAMTFTDSAGVRWIREGAGPVRKFEFS